MNRLVQGDVGCGKASGDTAVESAGVGLVAKRGERHRDIVGFAAGMRFHAAGTVYFARGELVEEVDFLQRRRQAERKYWL